MQNANLGGPLAFGLAILRRNGWNGGLTTEDGLLNGIEGKLLDPSGNAIKTWNPAMVNDDFPAYKAKVLSLHGRQAVIDAVAQWAGTGNPMDPRWNPATPGGSGPGSHVLAALLVQP